MSVAAQVSIIFAGINGLCDEVPVEEVTAFEERFLAFLNESYPDILYNIETTSELSADDEENLKRAAAEFKTKK